jgi:hypothetical protein
MPTDTPLLTTLSPEQAGQVIANLEPCYHLDLMPGESTDELCRALQDGGGIVTVYAEQHNHHLVVCPAANGLPLRLYLCDGGYWAHHLDTGSADEFVRVKERVATAPNGDRIYLDGRERMIFYVRPPLNYSFLITSTAPSGILRTRTSVAPSICSFINQCSPSKITHRPRQCIISIG